MAPLLGMLGVSAGTIGTLSSIATIAGPVLGVMGAISNVRSGKQQQAEFDRQARDQRVAANIQASRMRRESRIAQSRDRTMMLEGGALSGTAFGVLEQNAAVEELDALTVSFQGEQAALTSEAQGRASKVSPLTIFSAAIEGVNNMDPLNIGGQV